MIKSKLVAAGIAFGLITNSAQADDAPKFDKRQYTHLIETGDNIGAHLFGTGYIEQCDAADDKEQCTTDALNKLEGFSISYLSDVGFDTDTIIVGFNAIAAYCDKLIANEPKGSSLLDFRDPIAACKGGVFANTTALMIKKLPK